MLVWGEYINDDVIDNVIWPRAAVINDILIYGSNRTNRETAIMLRKTQL